MKNSRISAFYKKTIEERLAIVGEWANLSQDELAVLDGSMGLSPSQANNMIENVIGTYSLPLGIATNFLINRKDYLIPLVIEEPSVVAALSNAARLFREGGGFSASSDEPIMIGQIQVLDVEDLEKAKELLLANKARLMQEADEIGGSIVKRGGGAVDIEVNLISDSQYQKMIILHLLYNTQDAMGANAINTAVEHIAPSVEEITGGRVNLRILSNLTDKRKARAEGMIPFEALRSSDMGGKEAAKRVVEAGWFAEVDPYRATTHNKGIMNGIDAIVMATGNDWRAVEAGAHAFAARDGSYRSLTRWWQDKEGNLHGSIELPLAVGIVGGATKVHPTAQVALKILAIESARELAEVIACVGLAQNFAAIKALATEGIQRGHMRMHAKQLAVAAGAQGTEVAVVTQRMIEDGVIRLERAISIVTNLRNEGSNEQ